MRTDKTKGRKTAAAAPADKIKALQTAMDQVEQMFGKGSIMKLGSKPVMEVPVLPTRSLALD